jgi:hypothetical protein
MPLTGAARTPNRVGAAAGAFSAGLGLLVLLGSYTGSTALVQVRAAFVPMPPNTALSFFLCGMGLLASRRRPSWQTTVAGALVSALGFLTLLQFPFDVSVGVDRLLMHGAIGVEVSHPGRMAPNTAVCFVVIGTALVLLGTRPQWRHRSLFIGLLGSVPAALGSATLIGYAGDLRHALSWGHAMRMAIHAAVGFAVLGCGIIACVWRDDRQPEPGIPHWLPFVVGSGIAIATLWLWRALLAEEHAHAVRVPHLSTLVLGAGFILAALTVFLLRRARRDVMRGC